MLPAIPRFRSEEPRNQLGGAPPKGNYLFFQGGVIRFGKLTMRDADLVLIDSDPRDPFDFYPEKYSVQLVAGYSKITSSGGLRTYMPDYGEAQAKNKSGGTSAED